ncbi:MAG: hypothetical protein R3C46_09725 [Hyphomonadaceae bacterium]
MMAAWSTLRDVRREAALNTRDFEKARLQRFRRFAAFAVANSSWYADIAREHSIDPSRATPSDFPVLTKSILMQNFDRVVTDQRVTKEALTSFLEVSKDPRERFLGRYRVMHTSGTSGEVGYFVYSGVDWIRGMMAGVARRRERRSMRSARPRARGGRFRVAFYGATGGHFAGVTMATAIQGGFASLFVESRAFEINAPLADTLAQLNAYQPDMLSGYTAALRVLGDAQAAGRLNIAPRGIGATGETVTQADMAALREQFGCEVISAYGCTEHLGLGSSDPGGETMTLSDHNLIWEFFPDHTLITNMFNRTLPLIRYRMSDVLTPLERPADAPHRLVVKNLVGRTERVPIFENASGERDFISPHTINEIFVPGVPRFQLHITGPSSFRFLVVLAGDLDDAGRAAAIAGVNARLREILTEKRMSNVTFEVVGTNDLPVNARTRKFQLIMDDREATSCPDS